jgi:hypothetical protein
MVRTQNMTARELEEEMHFWFLIAAIIGLLAIGAIME